MAVLLYISIICGIDYRENKWELNNMYKLGLVIIIMMAGIMGLVDPIQSAASEIEGELIIALDPGHGGEEDGANYYGEVEKDVNLKIAKYVKEGLEQYDNVDVFLTREGDEQVSLKERVDRATQAGADMFISLHCNASVSHKSHGASVYISTGEGRRKELREFADYFLGEFEAIGLDNAGTFARVTQMGGRRGDGSFDPIADCGNGCLDAVPYGGNHSFYGIDHGRHDGFDRIPGIGDSRFDAVHHGGNHSLYGIPYRGDGRFDAVHCIGNHGLDRIPDRGDHRRDTGHHG